MAIIENLDAFFADFGVAVSFSGSSAGMKGLMDDVAADVLGDRGRAPISAVNRSVVVKTSQLGTLAAQSAITVNSVSRVVREIQPVPPDESLSVVFLR